MRNLRPLQSLLHAVIGTLVLALVVRTWLVMGLVVPVTVAGSSMAPTLRGAHLHLRCPQCESEFSIAEEFSLGSSETACPRCGKEGITLDRLPIHPGDGIWIDRQSFATIAPQRGELMVLRSPEDGTQLCIKRVWGLPGEQVELRHGDVLVDGTPVKKSLPQQRTLRRLVHQETTYNPRWRPDSPDGWKWHEQSWKLGSKAPQETAWLRYVHKENGPITDDLAYNAGLSRQLNPVRDLMLSVELSMQGTGKFHLKLNDGQQDYRVTVEAEQREIRATIGDDPTITVHIPLSLVDKLKDGSVALELSNFDSQLLLAVDGHVLFVVPIESINAAPPGVASPFAIGARGLEVELRRLTVFRDTYFTTQAVGLLTAIWVLYQTGPRQIFSAGR